MPFRVRQDKPRPSAVLFVRHGKHGPIDNRLIVLIQWYPQEQKEVSVTAVRC
jgi:hypothetical protein